MIESLIGSNLSWEGGMLLRILGFLFAFAGVYCLTGCLAGRLPKDGGRDFAHDGKLSAGKPRGAGIIFVCVFVVAALLFIPFRMEYLCYGALILVCMMTGFLDDAASTPWGEYVKGFLDLLVAIATGIAFVAFNGTHIYLPVTGRVISLHPVLYVVLAVILVWAAINVTNCTDGVDGLSASLTIVALLGLVKVSDLLNSIFLLPDNRMLGFAELFIGALAGYLWYNATPSKLMMGDAGSRAMGLLIALFAMESGNPLFFVPMALVIILDGGLGLVKVFLLRFLKIRILKNTRTPLHDHVRKNKEWSNTHTVFRFVILQVVVSIFAFALVLFLREII